VLVGPNASGKSNILDCLRFLQRAVSFPPQLSEAVIQLGGARSILGHRPSSPVTLGFEMEIQPPHELRGNGWPSETSIMEYTLSFELREGSFRIISERLNEIDDDSKARLFFARELDESGHLRILPGERVHVQDVLDMFTDEVALLTYPLMPAYLAAMHLREIQFIDFDPNAARRRSPSVSDSKLASNGENLAHLLAGLDEVACESVRDAIRRDVPGFRDFRLIRQGEDLVLSVDEDVAINLPASSISDGTLFLMALYASYYGSNVPPIFCIEEPERLIHPALIETLAEYLKSLGERGQVVVTTHSPEFVNWCDPSDLVLLEKRNGSTYVNRVQDGIEVARYLKEWTLGDLWERELLPIREVSGAHRVSSSR
jgi:predicted ATPase